MADFEGIYRALLEYFEADGWEIDHEKGEALMSSGYGSGPAEIDLNALAVKISKSIGDR